MTNPNRMQQSRFKQKAVAYLNNYFTGESIDYKQIIAIIIPIFVDQAFIIVMSLLNTAMISSSGVAAVSAVSMVDSLNIFIMNVFVAIATGGTVIVAQYKGGCNPDRMNAAASQAISAVTIVAVLTCLLMISFHGPALNFLFGNAESDVLHYAKVYLIANCISYPFYGIYQAVTGVLRGVSDTKASLALSLIMNLTHFVLNLILIIFFDMGVFGLAISLIAARILGMASALLYLVKYNHTLRFRIRNALTLQFSILKKILFIGIPFAAEQMFFSGGKLLTQTFIVQFGTLAITANAIGNSISLLFQVGGAALSISIVTVVGQCIGRKNVEDARKFIRSFLWLSSIFFVAVGALLLPLFPFLVRLFSPPEEIIPTIFILILLLAISEIFLWSASFILPSALRAAGDSKYTSIASLLSMWLFRIVLGYILGVTLNFGIIGVWSAMVAEWGVRSFIFYRRFKGDKWYKHKLI